MTFTQQKKQKKKKKVTNADFFQIDDVIILFKSAF